jgi:hypothetical protein
MRLAGSHAEDVGGGRVIEPGQAIPRDADPELVARLKAEGRLAEPAAAPKRSKEE